MDVDTREQPFDLWSDNQHSRTMSSGKIPVPEEIVPLSPIPQEVPPFSDPSLPAQTPPTPTGAQPPKRISRRKLIAGGAGAGVVGTAAAGYLLRQQMDRQEQQSSNSKWPGWISSGKGLSIPNHDTLSINSQVGHLLRRAGFGATAAELKEYEALGYTATVDRLLNYEQVPDQDLDARLDALGLDLDKPRDQQRWWLLRMAWTKRPLLEKMTYFWHGHFTSSYEDVGGDKAYRRIIVQNQFLREHAFDTFDTLLTGITSDPAMLHYLDLNSSHRNKPNENYARELMELFTIGLGHYTQQDVYEAAVALTGWHVRGNELSSVYLEYDHNTNEKVFLGKKGNLDYKDIITTLANHQATPWFISRKLFTFFVHENPTNDDLKPLVEAYVKNNHSMKAVMKALFLSPQFFDEKAYRTRVKSPVEFVVGAFRALEITGDGAGLSKHTISMGQELFNPPNVAGWPGHKNSSTWLSSGTWMARLNYIDQLLLGSKNTGLGLDLQKIVDDNQIKSPEAFVDFFCHFLLDAKVDPDRRKQFIEYFTAQENASRILITLGNGKSYPINRVRGTVYLILSSPEYLLN